MRTEAAFARGVARAVWLLAVFVMIAASALPARAQTATDASLYQQFGATRGLATLVDAFAAGLQSDPRTRPFFKDVDMAELKPKLVTQFCELAGGPCKREGKYMHKVHDAQDITLADFNAVVEVLQAAMDAQGIAFSTQNRLLAKLAPMHREIVNAH